MKNQIITGCLIRENTKLFTRVGVTETKEGAWEFLLDYNGDIIRIRPLDDDTYFLCIWSSDRAKGSLNKSQLEWKQYLIEIIYYLNNKLGNDFSIVNI